MMNDTKNRFVGLREKLTSLSDAFEVVERAQEESRDRLIGQIDAVLGLLGQMLEQHEARVEVARDIRERIDSTLDERLRLSVVGGGANVTQAGGAR
jgi:hypothetical protein